MPIDSLVLKDRRKAPIYRSWWTRERVLQGLQRLYADTGRAPNCSCAAYQRLMRELGQQGLKGGRRRYPSDAAVLRYWPSLAAAWRELGIVPDGRLVLTFAPDGSVAGRAGRREVGERHGRLTVVEFAGYYYWGKDGQERKARWRCRCDCGGERIVEAGRFKDKRECTRCAYRRGRALSLARASAQRAVAQVQVYAPLAATQERA